jgi:hypothetical protein
MRFDRPRRTPSSSPILKARRRTVLDEAPRQAPLVGLQQSTNLFGPCIEKSLP